MSEIARNSIISQSNALKGVANLIDKAFADAVQLIYNSKGRVVITGIGKSAIIAKKIVATLHTVDKLDTLT